MKKFNPQKTKNLKEVNRLLNLVFHTPKAKENVDWINVKKILIVDFTGIGDLIMLLPFLRILKKNSPDSCIDLACNGFAETLIGDQGLVRKFYPINAGNYINNAKKLIFKDEILREYIKNIKNEIYDVIIEPRGDLRYIYFMYLLNAKRKISYTYTGGQALLTDPIEPDDSVRHLKEDKLVLLKKIGCVFNKEDEIPYLRLSTNRSAFVNNFIQKNDINNSVIGIHPGASQELRRWNKYPDLMEKIYHTKNEITFLVFSSKGEEEYAEQLKNRGEKIGCTLYVINENLNNYISLLSLCDLIICNDSGAAHIGAALEVPVVVLYGANVPSFSCPTGNNTVINVSNSFDCKPCGLNKCRHGTNQCINSITVNQVYDEIEPFVEKL